MSHSLVLGKTVGVDTALFNSVSFIVFILAFLYVLCPWHLTWMHQQDTLFSLQKCECVFVLLDIRERQPLNSQQQCLFPFWYVLAWAAATGSWRSEGPLEALLKAKQVGLENREHPAATVERWVVRPFSFSSAQ